MATNEQILNAIYRAIEKNPLDTGPYEDAFSCIRNIYDNKDSRDTELSKVLKRKIQGAMSIAREAENLAAVNALFQINNRVLCWEAPVCFDSFLLFIETGRPYEKQFYLPRRRYLLPIVNAYQDLADGKLKLLTLSMPKRAGKSQTGINFVNWISGKHPERSTLMEGTGDDLVKSFYLGCLEYLQTPSEYLYYDVFPTAKLVQQNADTKIINLNEKSRFPTIMCRSIDARQVGLSEATNVLYLDDCVEGREEAKNRARLDEKWEIISGDVIGRAIEGTPIVATGTRYSLYDPIGRLQEEAKAQGWPCKFIEIPALDPVTDESNYEYYNPKVGQMVFTTQYFREQRDMLSAEQFESEFQQQPFEAKGLLFQKERLNYYFELPTDTDPDAVIAICDTAERGSDSTSMGIFKIYGQDVFLDDLVFDNSAPEITKPQCAKKIMDNKASVAVFESNNAGEYYARDVEQIVKSNGGRCSVRTKRTISNKQTRIEIASDGILQHFYFKHPTTYDRNSQYADFMRELTTYTRSGKVAHDDAPDMLSLAENEIRNLGGAKAEVIRRPW